MKTTMSFFLVIILLLFGACDKVNKSPDLPGAESTVKVAAHYLDNIFMNTLSSLEIIAETPEAKDGNWEGIKPYLQDLAKDLPGVYFFVLPDGNYYTITKDYTNLNLSNRPYFKPLFNIYSSFIQPSHKASAGRRLSFIYCHRPFGSPLSIFAKATMDRRGASRKVFAPYFSSFHE